jgi:protein dithiol oxidoreductase (disulfide-forming)
MKKLFLWFVFAFIAIPAGAQQQQRQAYTELKPALAAESDGKIEVLEFFWYGCIHCYHLEPYIESWLKKLPPDTQFRRVPAVFNQRWALDAAIFYTFEAMGLLDKLHRPLFDAIHKGNLRTDNQEQFNAFLQKNGVDPKKFLDIMKSFGVQSRTKRATQLTAAYKIDGTPAMAVQGRYMISADIPGMLNTVDQLVAEVRKNGKK